MLKVSRLYQDYVIGAVVILLFALLQWWQPAWLNRLEGISYDFKLLHFSQPQPKSDVNIQIVDIDEKSIKELGRWPWPRKYLADLLTQLKQQGAVVVAFDMLFSEPQLNPAKQLSALLLEVNNKLNITQVIDSYDNDKIFAHQMNDIDVVLGTLFQQDAALMQGNIVAPAIVQPQQKNLDAIIHFQGFNASIDTLNNKAQGQGFINAVLDDDGFIRRVALLASYQDKLFASLALETFRVYSFVETITPIWKEYDGVSALTGVEIGKEFITTDSKGQLLVPFRGPAQSYPYSSAVDVITDQISDNRFDGAVVFVGTSSVGIADLRATPMSVVFPGVEIHATAFDALTQPQYQIVQPDWWLGANMVLIFVLGFLVTVVLKRLSPLNMLIVACVIITGVWGSNITLWYIARMHLPNSVLLLMLITLAVTVISRGFYQENQQRRQVKAIFDQYVPPAHIDRLLANPNDAYMRGERKELTVLFADIRNFTEHAEQMTADSLKQMLNAYFSPITKVIFNTQGTIDKYVGDMVMAFWGAPLANEHHANHAIDAAFEMLKCSNKLTEAFIEHGWPQLNIGIGINTGMMNVGDMGSQYRRAYTVIGDAVNLGSRLESLTKFYGVDILVSEYTVAQCSDYQFLSIDKVKVKGKNKAFSIFSPLAKCATDKEQKQLQSFNQVFASYLKGDFVKANTLLTNVINMWGEHRLYSIYQQRLTQLIANPPTDIWDGIYTHKSK